MGTSKAYSASVSGQPQWGRLSSTVTRACHSGHISQAKLKKIVSRYVETIGGAARAGKGGSKIAGHATLRTAKRLGGFIGGFISSGGDIRTALQQTGLINLNTRSVSEIINHLIEYCSGPAATIDDSAAKEASRILLEELIGDAHTLEEMQERLQAHIDQNTLEEIMVKYFGIYIHEHLSRMFYEKLIKEKGKALCNNLFKQIKEFIFARLERMNKNNPLNTIDWGSDEGEQVMKRIQFDVLTVFEDYEN